MGITIQIVKQVMIKKAINIVKNNFKVIIFCYILNCYKLILYIIYKFLYSGRFQRILKK